VRLVVGLHDEPSPDVSNCRTDALSARVSAIEHSSYTSNYNSEPVPQTRDSKKIQCSTESPYTHNTLTMADALKAEGNKLFAEKKFAESM
jgi:hypothetical protein